MIRPTAIALAISRGLNGTCIPQPATPLRWIPCPECAPFLRIGQQRLTHCKVCDGLTRLAVLPS